MKILAISNLYPPNAVGGYEILCFEVMQAMAVKGHEVTVLTSNYGGKLADYPNHQVLRTLNLLATEDNIYEPFAASLAVRTEINRRNIATLNQTLADLNPDLVFIWNQNFYDASLLEALERSGRRLVYLLTDNWLIAFYNGNFIADYFSREVYATADRWRTLLRRIKRRLAGAAATVPTLRGSAIFASRFMQQLYREAGFSFSDSTIIHHGVSAPLTAPVPLTDRSQLVKGQELRMLFAGRVVEIKGIHTAIEALPQIIQALPSMRVNLSIVGDDRDQSYLAQLKNRIEQLGITGIVNFAPPVPEADLFQLFQEHDIYLFPSLYEPFSLTLIHALQAGIPTVASDVGGNPEIVLHRQTGMLFRKADPAQLATQVINLAHNSALRTSIAAQAREHASDFTFARMIGQIEVHLSAVFEKTL
ncbi:MAG: glycosyltransferase family 4 protein [Steroidobacteraceae bacterium]|nr:glycosyltransferase family 4 protein [Deltaproteobacteria bacterium]